uniref:Uncharacterized protein n=1 Tax=Arundo donax TaxID=35708 RepID=A0A0A9B2C4_ARUDO
MNRAHLLQYLATTLLKRQHTPISVMYFAISNILAD